jgi:predicted RNase H-like HicB family nuclease
LKYAIVITRTGPRSYSVHSPDIPLCIAAGHSKNQAIGYFRQAVEYYLNDLREMGKRPPRPTTFVDTIEVGSA